MNSVATPTLGRGDALSGTQGIRKRRTEDGDFVTESTEFDPEFTETILLPFFPGSAPDSMISVSLRELLGKSVGFLATRIVRKPLDLFLF